jgi:diamine N-acetyltransferase
MYHINEFYFILVILLVIYNIFYSKMHTIATISLKDNHTSAIRLLQKEDADALYDYLNGLSAESRSRFGPHAFDRDTIDNICNNLNDDIQRYVAIAENSIAAYMLIKRGLTDADAERYAQKQLFFDVATTVTYAPSVADGFQNSGLGSAMFAVILQQIKLQGDHTIILWGGVQATNTRAVHFYTKHGFESKGNFWFDGKDNIDMLLNI